MEGTASGVKPIITLDAPSDDPALKEAEERAAAEGWHWEGHMATEGEVVDLIFALVCAVKPDVMVETGTFLGHTTKSISEAMERNGKGHLWTIENDGPLCDVYSRTNLPRTSFICADSVKWSEHESPDVIDIAFVDCGPPPIRCQVVRNLYPKVRDGGLILVHDTHFHDGFLAELRDILGAPQIDLPALHGLAIWQP